MTDLLINYLAVNVICSIALIILVYLSWSNVLLVSQMKNQFALAGLIAIVVILSEMTSVIFENIEFPYRAPALIANIIGFSLSPFIGIVLSNAFSIEKGKIRTLLIIPVWINFILVISSPWTGLIFRLNTDISYSRGPMFVVYVIAYLCSFAILIMNSAKAMKHYQCNTKFTFIMLLIFTIAGTGVQLIMPQVHASWLCVTLSLVLFYAYFCVLTETQDTLTGLLNRTVYDRYTKNLDHDNFGTVILFDMDSFKDINDSYGHQWGDTCLQMVGSLIKECFQKIGFCYRIGGDEFCVICKKADEQLAKDTLSLFHRKIDSVRKSNKLQADLPTVSTGYAIFHGSTEEYGLALKKADEQMSIYKNNRKLDTDILKSYLQ